MKKILISSLALLLALTFVCSALAEGKKMNETFTLRGMKLFGMTKSQVIEAEQKNGNSIKEDAYSSNKATVEYTTLAGFPNSRLKYTFDDNTDVCKAVSYELSIHEDGDKASISANAYKIVYATLVDKYGKPNWSKYIDNPRPPMMSNFSSKYFYGRILVENLDSWLLEFDDYYVNIVLYKWQGVDKYSTYYYCDVLYHIRSKEQMNDLWKNEQKQQEQRSNDL